MSLKTKTKNKTKKKFKKHNTILRKSTTKYENTVEMTSTE